MLTPKQRKLFDLLEGAMRDDGVCPTFEELRLKLGLASKASIHSMMNSLERRGYIRRLPYRARAIEILRPTLAESSGDRIFPGTRENPGVLYDIPVVGVVPAGTPIVAWETTHRYVTVPPAFARPAGNHYALDIRGDSMTGAGIREGDIAIIRHQATANSGDIVVALVEGENTLKRLHIDTRRRRVKLIAENPNYRDILIRSSEFEIQGRLVSLLRRYGRRTEVPPAFARLRTASAVPEPEA